MVLNQNTALPVTILKNKRVTIILLKATQAGLKQKMKLHQLKKSRHIDFFTADTSTELALPLAGTGISAGFPSPADDYMEMSIDLNRELIHNPTATFYGRVKGTSMRNVGIEDGDVLVIDRSLELRNGSIAICFLDGDFTVKRVKLEKGEAFLIPENPEYQPIRITAENEFVVWGIVTYVIKKM